jgi:hypothetical protein
MRQISLVDHFYTYAFANPPSAVGLTYKDFTYLKLDEGGIIVGQATSFKDFNAMAVTAAAASGFFYGFETINSCFILDGTWVPTDNTPNPYSAITATLTKLSGNTGDLSNISESVTKSALTNSVNSKNFNSGSDYVEISATCSQPTIYPASISD